jgi:hypothetical protein
MKLTKSQLQSTIQEELQKLLQEDIPPTERYAPFVPTRGLRSRAYQTQRQAATGQAGVVGAVAGGATDAASEAAIWVTDKMPKGAQRAWMDYFGSGDQGELVRDVAGLIGSVIGKGVDASRDVYEALGLPQWGKQDWEIAARRGLSRTLDQVSQLSPHGRDTGEETLVPVEKLGGATTPDEYARETSRVGSEAAMSGLMMAQLGLTLSQLAAARSAASEAMAAGAGAEDALIAAETAAAGEGAAAEAVGNLRSTGAHLGKHGREQYRRGSIMDRESFAGANRPYSRQTFPKSGEQLSFGEQGRMIWPRGAGDSKPGWPVSAGATARGEYMSLPTRARPLAGLAAKEAELAQTLAPTGTNISRMTPLSRVAAATPEEAALYAQRSGLPAAVEQSVGRPGTGIGWRPPASGGKKWIPRIAMSDEARTAAIEDFMAQQTGGTVIPFKENQSAPLEKIIKEELQKLLQS